MDCLIVGGGVIGLSLAYELATAGLRVRVIDQGSPGCEASWAGAGILPPAVQPAGAHPYDQLVGLSNSLHCVWTKRLYEETGIDNGHRRCGGIYLATTSAEADELHVAAQSWQERGIQAQKLSAAELRQLEPYLADNINSGYHLPDEAQLRNPWHLKALLAACARHKVEVLAGVQAEEIEVRGDRIDRVVTTSGVMAADKICITTGAFSHALIRRLECSVAIKPVRGQMVLLSCPHPLMKQIINVGKRYLVPRADGRVLVGSTEEDAGFDRRTTAEAIFELLRFACGLVPALAGVPMERCWAGLRPATFDGRPYLGPVPGLSNAFIAAGHFRSGLQLSTGTAMLMAQLIRGEEPGIDLAPFRIGRD